MKRTILSLLLSFSAAFTSACFEAGNMSVQIKETGLAENVLSVRALTGDGTVHLEWELPSGAKGVSIRRDTMPPFSVTSGTEIYCGPEMSYIDTTAELNTAYYYLVVAIDNNMNFAGGVIVTAQVFDYGMLVNNSYSKQIYCYDEVSDIIYTRSSGNGYIESRRNTDGFLNTSFGQGGIVYKDYTDTRYTTGAVIDAEYIYFFGGDDTSSGYYAPRLEKRNKTTGILDTAFDGDGIITYAPSTNIFNSNYIHSLFIDSDYIYVYRYEVNSPIIEKRDKTSGMLDNSFDGDGSLTLPSIAQVSFDGEFIYIFSYKTTTESWGTNYLFEVEKRSKATGALDTSFDSDGVWVVDPSSETQTISASPKKMIIDEENIFLNGHLSNGFNVNDDILIKLKKSSGSLDTSFGNNGFFTIDPAGDGGNLTGLISDGNYLYISGWYDSDTGQCKFIEKRDKTACNYDESFGDNGLLVFSFYDIGNFDEVLIHEDSIYIASDLASQRKHSIQKRRKDTGILDTEFANGGIFSVDYKFNTSGSYSPVHILGDNMYFSCHSSIGSGTDYKASYKTFILNRATGALRTGALFENPAPDVE